VQSIDTFLQRKWWGEDDHWYSQVLLGGGFFYGEDQGGNLLHRGTWFGCTYEGPMRSLFNIEGRYLDEVSDGVLFPDQIGANYSGWIWPSGDLQLRLSGRLGDQIDYDNNRQGDEIVIEPGLLWRPGTHWEINVDHQFNRLDVADGRLFTANLSRARLAYHFNVRTFLRAIVHYTDIDRDPNLYRDEVEARSRELFTQFLFSYKVNPRTVIFVGYSDTTESNDTLADVVMNRSVFIKLGYAWLL
jgi:hypothetical protein